MVERKRGYDECMCPFCAPQVRRGLVRRRYLKKLTRMKDRAWDKARIKEEYDDFRYGVDPD